MRWDFGTGVESSVLHYPKDERLQRRQWVITIPVKVMLLPDRGILLMNMVHVD